MILNGAIIRFKTRARLELNNHARFLFGKQIMQAEDASSPARQAYYALQEAYIGKEEERAAALCAARDLLGALSQAADERGGSGWSALLCLCTAETILDALKLARQMVRAEDLSLPP